MASSTIVGLGLISLDLAIEVADLPVDGRIHAERALRQGGGMAANTLAALAALGWRVEMVGAVGTDEAGKQAIQSLRAAGVGTKWVQRRKGAVTPQAVCIAQVEHGRRTIIGLPECGCEMRICELPAFLTSPRSPSPNAGILHTDGWHGAAAVKVMQTARGRGWMTSYNGGWVTTHSRRLARLADVVVVSRDFARELTTEKKPAEMLRAVGRWIGDAKDRDRLESRSYTRNGERWLVLTAGPEGAWGWSGSGGVSLGSGKAGPVCRKMTCHAHPTALVYRPAFSVKVVDSTGAGDAFHAGLLHGRLKGWSLEESLCWAAAAGALACTELGARANKLNSVRIQQMLGKD